MFECGSTEAEGSRMGFERGCQAYAANCYWTASGEVRQGDLSLRDNGGQSIVVWEEARGREQGRGEGVEGQALMNVVVNHGGGGWSWMD